MRLAAVRVRPDISSLFLNDVGKDGKDDEGGPSEGGNAAKHLQEK